MVVVVSMGDVGVVVGVQVPTRWEGGSGTGVDGARGGGAVGRKMMGVLGRRRCMVHLDVQLFL